MAMTEGISAVVFLLQLFMGFGFAPAEADLTRLGKGFVVEQGQIEWTVTQTAAEDAAFADLFWPMVAVAESQNALAGSPLLFWLYTGASMRPVSSLQMTEFDPVTRTLRCTSALPFGRTAERFLTALGCLIPRV